MTVAGNHERKSNNAPHRRDGADTRRSDRPQGKRIGQCGQGIDLTLLIDIVRANVFTLFNGIIFAAMVMVLITGSWRDAVFGMIIIINTGIGICTELKAKRTLDKLSILVASDYLVHRDGKDVEIPHNDIVLGDFMWIRSGEQVPADAQIVHTWGLELDESMLTGESRTVRKGEGCDIFSGSTATSGMALVKVTAVGEHSYAAKLTARAKVYRKTVSDLNKGINTILKFMTFLVVPLCVLLIWSQVRTVGGWNVAISTGEWRSAVISAVAGVVGMILRLVLLTSLNFALAAIRLARKNTLVQELESVETLARVDCLNLDKTGTVTDGTIRLDSLELLGVRGPDDMRGTVNEHDVRQVYSTYRTKDSPTVQGKRFCLDYGNRDLRTALSRHEYRSRRRASGVRSMTAMQCGRWVRRKSFFPKSTATMPTYSNKSMISPMTATVCCWSRESTVQRPTITKPIQNSIRHRALSHWCAVPNIFAPTPKKRLHGSVNKACVAASSLVTIP